MKDGEHALQALVAQAIAASQGGRWAEAAEGWKRAGALARRHRAHGTVAQCAEQEGECWRRADDAVRAEQALQQALSQVEPPSDPVTTCARLAAVLGERGAGRRALAVGRQAVHMAQQTGSPSAPIALDTLVGQLQAYGRKEDQRPVIEALVPHLGPEAPAVRFRRGQLHRLDGELDAADECFAAVEAALEGVVGAEAGVAAAAMERAEIALLRGRTAGAVDAFVAAHALHDAAGRRSLAWRCEVGRVRASVRVGLEPVAPGLGAGQAWARERGLGLLAVDLRVARGLCLVGQDGQAAVDELLGAAAEAGAMGSGPRVGRIYLHLLAHGAPDPATRAAWGRLALGGLVDNVPLLREAQALVASS